MPADSGSGGVGPGSPVFRFDGSRLSPYEHHPVSEIPVQLTVNGNPLATLVASPHQLEFLVAGFLRMQRLVSTRDDIELLGVCPDSRSANVKIRGKVPENLIPILTSGCTGGVTFDLPRSRESEEDGGHTSGRDRQRFSCSGILRAMEGLGRIAGMYRSTGGIHSSAVSDGKTILLHAEDIGRHNTIDRIAGEALLKGIDLAGMMLVTSGRISSEMAAKGASLGVSVMASRTSPTDMAIRIAGEAGITLIGYVRGGRFSAYTHPGRIFMDRAGPGLEEEVTGVILAGGPSSRMGKNKALLPWRGATILEEIYRRMARIFREVILVTNSPEDYSFLPCRRVPDLYHGLGSLAGIHAGLRHSGAPHIFAVACDMPCLEERLIRYLLSLRGEADAVIPEAGPGLEPLHGVYSAGLVPALEEALESGERRAYAFLGTIHVRKVGGPELAPFDPNLRSFRNINTPEDYSRLLVEEAASPGKAVSFVADSGTGKTTLLEKVIASLKGRGYRVGVIKHDAHRFEIDHPGKDSYRLSAAGADTMVITSAEKLAMVKKHDAPPDLEELIETCFGDADIVLTEGFRKSRLPKIEVHRKERSGELLCRGARHDPALLAVVSDEPLSLDVPVFGLNDPDAIADFLVETFLAPGNGSAA